MNAQDRKDAARDLAKDPAFMALFRELVGVKLAAGAAVKRLPKKIVVRFALATPGSSI